MKTVLQLVVSQILQLILVRTCYNKGTYQTVLQLESHYGKYSEETEKKLYKTVCSIVDNLIQHNTSSTVEKLLLYNIGK